MARKKTPPWYGESAWGEVSLDAVIYVVDSIFEVTSRERESGLAHGHHELGDKIRLTGPMMVACQWNCDTRLISKPLFHDRDVCVYIHGLRA